MWFLYGYMFSGILLRTNCADKDAEEIFSRTKTSKYGKMYVVSFWW
jgi:hypothetical protein